MSMHICSYIHTHRDKHTCTLTGALISCALNNKNNNSSSYYLLRAMYQPPWSVLYKALSQSSDHLYEAHFTDKEADINLG